MKANSSYQLASGYAKNAILILLLVGLVGFTVVSVFDNQAIELDPVVAFAFETYCPIDSTNSLSVINKQLALQGIPPLNFDFSVNPNIYVVNVQSRPSDPNNPNSSALLYYCGMAKQWWEASCFNAKFVCSIPGPMFYFPMKQQATIIWINGINFKGLNYTHANCYDQETSTDHDCTVTTKPQEWENCTYFQPTDYQYSHSQTHRLTKDSIPISPHIHGLEVRPVFDGNPLSWFTPDGIRGPGFQTLYNQRYFFQFNKMADFNGKRQWEESLRKRTKIIQVTNDQSPGLLFYHDHAMKSTLYNVQFGLGGLYVITDPYSAEADLPYGKYEKFIVFSKQGDARTKSVLLSPDVHTQNGVVPQFQRSATYRFRILNAAFDNVFNNVVFAAYYTIKQVKGKYTYTEIDPSNTTYDLDSNKHLIPFTVIGTDTTLFHEAVNDVSFLNFGPAERVDLLIRFDVELPSNINNVYFVCDDLNQGETVIKYQFVIEKTPRTLIEKMLHVLPDIFTVNEGKVISERDKFPKDYKLLNTPYTNLSKVSENKIQVRRHRPLFSLPYDTRFMIGAHYMFEDGATDLPKIGTVDDFYMINNLWEDHPMHIHLINHQVVKAYSLKQLPENPNCTLYLLDFFRLSGLEEFKGLSNIDLCNYIWDLEESDVLDLFMRLKDYRLESKVETTENGLISGLDVMVHSNGDTSYIVGNCSLDSTHKYICEETPEAILEHQRRWKDTTMVHSYSVFVLRVRWASTLYNPAVRPYPYFNIPEEHLVEFPGFVYHCHILPHEDNEMMRSFSLQYSDIYKSTIGPKDEKRGCVRNNWWDQMKCINDMLGCRMTQ